MISRRRLFKTGAAVSALAASANIFRRRTSSPSASVRK